MYEQCSSQEPGRLGTLGPALVAINLEAKVLLEDCMKGVLPYVSGTSGTAISELKARLSLGAKKRGDKE
jgi:hypothetical protein